MKNTFLILLLFVALTSTAFADKAPVSMRLPEKEGWVGQRLPFFIELSAPGSFEGRGDGEERGVASRNRPTGFALPSGRK